MNSSTVLTVYKSLTFAHELVLLGLHRAVLLLSYTNEKVLVVNPVRCAGPSWGATCHAHTLESVECVGLFYTSLGRRLVDFLLIESLTAAQIKINLK